MRVRVTIIRAGRAAETGTSEELRHLTRTTVVVETARPVDALSGLPGVHDLSVDHTRAHFSVDAGELNRVLAQLVEFDVRSSTSSPAHARRALHAPLRRRHRVATR